MPRNNVTFRLDKLLQRKDNMHFARIKRFVDSFLNYSGKVWHKNYRFGKKGDSSSMRRYCMVMYGILWYCMVLHGIA